jgi:hypothetical protein
MSGSILRIHPAIGLARVGNSEEYYIGPETAAGMPVKPDDPTMGGLPIKPGTESDTITSSDVRDANGALKRQAARFRIFQYSADEAGRYPSGGGTEIQIGSTVDGKEVVDIIWTAHLANKKANWYQLDDDRGVKAYDDGATPSPRNPDGQGSNPDNPERLRKLVIDPGPRAIKGSSMSGISFDKKTEACYWESGDGIQTIGDYPKSFPDDAFDELEHPSDVPIETLGELQTDDKGRLLVLAAFGTACAWYKGPGEPYPLPHDVNNDGWFDDVADGPVTAVLVFEDGSVHEVGGGAWVITTDPAYAPQIPNAVSLWDDIFDSWVRKLDLMPDLFSSADGSFNSDYRPSFDDDVRPMFRSAGLQRWIANFNILAIGAHADVDKIAASDDPEDTMLGGLGFIRDPDDEAASGKDRTMPLSLGDAGESFLSLSKTQFFFLKQWNARKAKAGPGPRIGAGEYLDRAVLANCLGGRFSPGIDMTFICREPDLYYKDWQATGPFRIKLKPLAYAQAKRNKPFLTGGYTPRRNDTSGLEPGDVSKFMAIPWHTDYNSCATHTPAPNPTFNNTLYWSWPAQRPVAVYVAGDVVDGKLPVRQRFSVRGEGTETDASDQVGRYQLRVDMIRKWQDIGVVIQGTAIDGGDFDAEHYLEVASRLDDSGNPVEEWPNTVPPGTGST